MECIICQDIGAEPLQDNTSCTCKYKVHNSCWIDYVNSKTNVTCLLCRKEHISTIAQEPHSNTHNDIVIIINQPSLVPRRDILASMCAAGISLSLAIIILVLIWK